MIYCWCAAFACRDLCLHVVWLGDFEVVLYHATKQESSTAVHASLMKLLLLADPKRKSELDSSCSCSYTDSSNSIKVTTILHQQCSSVAVQACQNNAGRLQEPVTRQTSTSML